MALTDALFEGLANLAGLLAKRTRDAKDARYMVRCRCEIPVSDGQLEGLQDAARRHTARPVVVALNDRGSAT